jgi:hypothetical protein
VSTQWNAYRCAPGDTLSAAAKGDPPRGCAAGDRHARDELIERRLPLARPVARSRLIVHEWRR